MTKPHRAQWLSDGALGLMVHYIIGPDGETDEQKTADFNRTVDAFPLDSFMEQFQQSGANWLIFTYGQCTSYFCSPNEYLDDILPGHTSERDLMGEIAVRVKAMGKRMIVYMATGFPMEIPGHDFTIDSTIPRGQRYCPQFVEPFGRFVRAYSHQLGTMHDGWWFDGVLDWLHREKTDWKLFCDDARAGNPDAIVALNDDGFCNGFLDPVSPEQDYLAGEVEILEDSKIQLGHIDATGYQTPDGKWRMRDKPPLPLVMPEQQFTKGSQWHALVPMDCNFSGKVTPHHYSDAELIEFVSNCKAAGGAVTFNLPFSNDGVIPQKSLEQFARMSRAVLG